MHHWSISVDFVNEYKRLESSLGFSLKHIYIDDIQDIDDVSFCMVCSEVEAVVKKNIIDLS